MDFHLSDLVPELQGGSFVGFTNEQLTRYNRHFVLSGIGAVGQRRISQAKVALIGAGGLGSVIGYYLCAAGIGKLAIVDNDKVELSNLQRQIAHNMARIDVNKAESAAQTYRALNPDVDIKVFKERLVKGNIRGLIADYDVVIDGSDNFQTRFLINDACVLMGKPLVSGAVLGFEGQLMVVMPHDGHCYRCVFEDVPPDGVVPTCREVGVLGAVPGVIGSLQAMEAIKLIVGNGEVLKGCILIYNALNVSFRKVAVQRNPSCKVCGTTPSMSIYDF
ncbi:MAG: molybdopterin-synthase adenylyltransferase MoeB [Candidatus Magnetoovum sp. WYHC-5]|nr:molybdopterin-synthase adenylyltransferase MoeB [Candidatus Magnetoovum sp. WYHC-5]